MKNVFEMVSKVSGKTIRIEGEYRRYMEMKKVDSDGIIIELGERPVEKGILTVYVDGKKVDSQWQVPFWRVIETQEGVKKIWGLNVGFADPDDADRYEAWLADLLSEGNECKEYDAEVEAKEAREAVRFAEEIVNKAEAQKDIPDAQEAKRRMEEYNRINNEGGEGFVPYIISKEEYEHAKEVIRQGEEV